jgi:sugar phosphate isomerase/epimerase
VARDALGVTGPTISLAAGTVLDIGPADTVDAAAAAGFPAVGVWVDLATWSPAVTTDVCRRLDASGLGALDAEVIRLRADHDLADARRVVDIAAAVGARFALVVSQDPDLGRTAAQYGELCAHGADVGVRPVLEFMRFMTVRTLPEAVDVVARAGHPDGAVLVDALHLDRGGHLPADVAALDPGLFPYTQLCDAVATAPPADELVTEALDGRLLPGDGDLPLHDLVAALAPATPLSVELRSAALRADYPDPTERARLVHQATIRFLTSPPTPT